MTASVIIIGTELTHGVIQDSHGSLLSRELSHLGIHVSELVIVPDDGSIEKVLEALIRNNDAVIITGGLGPTSDDITRSVIAEAAKVPLVRNPDAWAFLLNKLGDRVYGANERQAMIPEGFSIIENPNGTAPGFYGYSGNTLLISLPGPPSEMHPMLYDDVLPLLREKLELPEAERDEYTSFITAEAKLEELTESVDPELDWGTRFQDYKISLYVSGKDKHSRLQAIESLRKMLGKYRIVDGNTDALEIAVNSLKNHNATISVAESCTGGLLSMLLTEKPGASGYMLGSVTAYAKEAKENVLGVPESLIEKYGTVSSQCAEHMADGARRLMNSDYAVSVTGVAGPDKDEDKDIGTVYLGFSGKGKKTVSVLLDFSSWGRSSVRRKSSVAALLLLSAYIEGEDVGRIVSEWGYI